MEAALRKNGLEHAIKKFAENGVQLHHLKKLDKSEIKELLPKVGDRVTFRDMIKRSGKKNESSETKPTDKENPNRSGKKSNSSETKPSDKEKPDVHEELVRNAHQILTEKSYKLLKKNVLEFYEGMEIQIRAKWISVTACTKNGSVNYNAEISCPICGNKYTPQYRIVREGKYDFQLGTFRVHLLSKHRNEERTEKAKPTVKLEIEADKFRKSKSDSESSDEAGAEGINLPANFKSSSSSNSSCRSDSNAGSSAEGSLNGSSDGSSDSGESSDSDGSSHSDGSSDSDESSG